MMDAMKSIFVFDIILIKTAIIMEPTIHNSRLIV